MSSESSAFPDLHEQRQLQLPHPDHPEDGHNDVVYRLHLQGDYLASVSADQTARIWDLKTRRLLHPPLIGHTGSVVSVQFDAAPQSDVIITGGTDGNVMIWRFSTGELIKTIVEAHNETVLTLHFDQKYLVTGGRDTKIQLWTRHALDTTHASVPSYAVPPPETDGTYPAYSLLATFTDHHAAVNALQLQNTTLVSGAGDWTLHIRDLRTRQLLHNLSIHEMGIACLRYNGRLLVSGSSDNTVKVYDVERGVAIACLRGHSNLVRAVGAVFADDGAEVKAVVSGGYDGCLRVWEPVSGSSGGWRTRQELYFTGFQADGDERLGREGSEFGKRIFSLGLDGKRLVCSGEGPMIRVWELAPPTV